MSIVSPKFCQRKKNARYRFLVCHCLLSFGCQAHNELLLTVCFRWDANITLFRRTHFGRRPLTNTLLRTLLTIYASHALASLLPSTLHHHFLHTASSLPSLLTQLTYCAHRLCPSQRPRFDFHGILGCSSGYTRCGCEVVRRPSHSKT